MSALFYRLGGKRRWSIKYKKKINCNNPKGFSQKQYCKRKKRGGNYKNESIVNSDYIKSTINDLLLEISDNSDWYFNLDGDSVSNYYEVYISNGEVDIRREEDDDLWGYEQRRIPKELIDCLERIIDFMKSEGFKYSLLFCSEYSSDRNEDVISNIELDDLYDDMIMSENESIRINFFKSY